MSESNPGVGERIEALREDYLARLPEKMTGLLELCQQVLGGSFDATSLSECYRQLHSLTGSAGTYRLAELADKAGDLESLVQPWAENGLAPDGPEKARIEASLADLHALIEGLAERGRRG